MELVERTTLLAQLSSYLAEARAGSGCAVLLGGEAGVGKTSVARAFVTQDAASLRVLWGTCEPLLTPEPLGPFHDMAPLAAAIAARPGRVELFRTLLDELAIPPCTVMVVDDAHWADDATLDAIRFLGRRVHSTAGMLLIGYREDEADAGSPLRAVLGDLATAPGSHHLHVPPLTVEAVTELAAGHALDAGRLHAITGGNPFYVTEVLAAAGWTVPPTVTDAVLARVSRLDPAARGVLEVVSLAPGGLEPAIAIEMSGAHAPALDACLEGGVLVMGPDRVGFRHELARLATEGWIPASRRRWLNRQLVDQLERLHGVDPARLAHHADAAGDAAAVLKYAPLAAREASQRGAHRAAAEHLGRAVARAESATPAMLADLVSAWADERMLFDDPRDVLELRQRAMDLRRNASDQLGEGREMLELSRVWSRLGDSPVAQRLAKDALDLLERLPPGPDLARAYAAAAWFASDRGDENEAIRFASDSIELATAAGVPAVAVLAHRVLGQTQIVRGAIQDGLESYAQARRVALAAGDHEGALGAAVSAANDLLGMHLHSAAKTRYEEAIDLGRAVDLDYFVGAAELGLSQLDFFEGRWTEAGRQVDRILAEQERYPLNRLYALTIRGRMQVRRGLPEGPSTLRAAWTITERTAFWQRWDIAAGLAEAAWLAGRSADIPSIVGDVYEWFCETDFQWAVGELGFWLWRAGALSELRQDAAEPFALHVAGEWRRAAACWEELGCPYEQAEALADGDEPAMRRALAIFSRLGAEPAADRLRERMRRAGVTHIPARPHRSNRAAPAQLTRRQLEILELLESGLTNGEIAARLFITEKTAGHHVSAILGKLGARSRTEAASTARKMGIVAS